MTQATHRARAMLSLCLLALGVFGAGSAQAATWVVSGVKLTSGSKALVGSLATTGVLHTKIGANAVEFSCVKLSLISAVLEPKGQISGETSGFQSKFQECQTKINGKVNSSCEPNDSGTNPGVLLTNLLKGLLILHILLNEKKEVIGKDGVVMIESNVRETISGVPNTPVFARIKMSAECPIGSNIPIIGQFGLKDVGGEVGLEEEKLTHELEEGLLTEFWALSKTFEHKISLLGKKKVSLVSDENWSGLRE